MSHITIKEITVDGTRLVSATFDGRTFYQDYRRGHGNCYEPCWYDTAEQALSGNEGLAWAVFELADRRRSVRELRSDIRKAETCRLRRIPFEFQDEQERQDWLEETRKELADHEEELVILSVLRPITIKLLIRAGYSKEDAIEACTGE